MQELAFTHKDGLTYVEQQIARGIGADVAPQMQIDANVMPGLLKCARAHVSEGEIIATLQEVFGSFKDVAVF